MATKVLPYDCSKNPPEWVSWRILDPKYPSHFLRMARGHGKKTCDQMIHAIVKLGIINQGKFKLPILNGQVDYSSNKFKDIEKKYR